MKKHRLLILMIGFIVFLSLVLLLIEKKQATIIEGKIVQTNKKDSINNFIQAYRTAIYKVGFTSKQGSNNINQTPTLFLENKISYINNNGKLNAVGENDKYNKFNSVLLKYR